MRRFWKSPLEELPLPAEPQLEAFISLWNLRALSDGPAEERYEHVRGIQMHKWPFTPMEWHCAVNHSA